MKNNFVNTRISTLIDRHYLNQDDACKVQFIVGNVGVFKTFSVLEMAKKNNYFMIHLTSTSSALDPLEFWEEKTFVGLNLEIKPSLLLQSLMREKKAVVFFDDVHHNSAGSSALAQILKGLLAGKMLKTCRNSDENPYYDFSETKLKIVIVSNEICESRAKIQFGVINASLPNDTNDRPSEILIAQRIPEEFIAVCNFLRPGVWDILNQETCTRYIDSLDILYEAGKIHYTPSVRPFASLASKAYQVKNEIGCFNKFELRDLITRCLVNRHLRTDDELSQIKSLAAIYDLSFYNDKFLEGILE